MRFGILVLGLALVGCKEKSAPSPNASHDMCFAPAQSMDYAKPRRAADAPYAECAAGVFSHCPPNDSYCSVPLNPTSTQAERAKGKNVCCYGK
jgi:hypothetical protein